MGVKKKRKPFYVIAETICVVIFLVAAGIFLYPFWTDFRDTARSNRQIEKFERLEKTSSESSDGVVYEQLLRELETYNINLHTNGQANITDPFEYEKFPVDISKYDLVDGMIGYVSIPKIKLKFPIYLGANYENMKNGAAVLGYSSAPISGNNTHCVLAGHNYWNGSKKFTDIATLSVGDDVEITNLWGTLKYKVCEAKVISPSDFGSLAIREGKEMLSVFTCYYTRQGKQRFVIICERVG